MVSKPKDSKPSPKVNDTVSTTRKVGRPKSPARTKSPGRPKSPGRTKSPVKSKSPGGSKRPGGPKSPSRRSPARLKKTESPPRESPIPRENPMRRSPLRKSPARTAVLKSVTERFDEKYKVSRSRPKIASELSDSESDVEIVSEIKEKPKATVRGRSRRTDSDVENYQVNITTESRDEVNNYSNEVFRRVTRLSQSREKERVVHLKHFDISTKKLGEFSDEDDTSPSVDSRGEKTPNEFGGFFGAVFHILTLPFMALALTVACSDKLCSFTSLPDYRKIKSFSAFVNPISILGYAGFVTTLLLLSALPFGGKKVPSLPGKEGKFVYVTNGLFSLFVLLSVGAGLELRGFQLANFLVEHQLHLLTAAIMFGSLLSIYLYLRSFYVPVSSLNPQTVYKPALCGFFLGKELNPRLLNIIDIKFFVYRLAVISAFLFNFAYLYKSLGITTGPAVNVWNILEYRALNIEPTLIVLVLLESIYLLDALIYESAFLSTFEVQYEGFGYMSAVGYPLHPFFAVLPIKYLAEYGVHLSTWQLVLSSIVYIVGYVLYRGSNNQKDSFRRNPYSSSSARLETIPTSQGKKLLVSGFWGVVRHPNYLGDILIHASYLPFVYNVPPCVYIWFTIFLLIHRTGRDHARCKQKYGTSWDRYCQRVKYVLIPKVY